MHIFHIHLQMIFVSDSIYNMYGSHLRKMLQVTQHMNIHILHLIVRSIYTHGESIYEINGNYTIPFPKCSIWSLVDKKLNKYFDGKKFQDPHKLIISILQLSQI